MDTMDHGTAAPGADVPVSEGAICPQPPVGADLSKLTSNQLAVYGLPQRPTAPSEVTAWAAQLRHAQHRVCTLTPIHGRHFTQNNSVWAGYDSTGGSYNYVYATWYVPCVTSASRATAYSSTWVGLSGTNLVQAGTEQNYDSVEAAYYDAWVEDYPFNEPQQITGMSVACGNLMSVYVSSDYDYRNQVYYSVFNESTNVLWPCIWLATDDWRSRGLDRRTPPRL